jgi:TonB family protein
MRWWLGGGTQSKLRAPAPVTRGPPAPQLHRWRTAMRQRTLGAVPIVALAVTLSCSACALRTVISGSEGTAWGPSLLPSSRDYYPSLAKEQGLTGRVGLECSVDGLGHAQNVVILESGGLVLDDAAKRIFSDGSFLIPPDWSAKGGPGKRFRYGVIFRLTGEPDVAPFEDHRITVVITGPRG